MTIIVADHKIHHALASRRAMHFPRNRWPVVRCRHFCWQQPWLSSRRNRPHGQRLGVSTHFAPRRWQVALTHVDGQRAVEHREDDAEPLVRRHAYADADAPSGLRGVTLADLALDFDRAGSGIHYAREFQQWPVVDNGHTSVESPLLRDEPLRAARSALQLPELEPLDLSRRGARQI